MSAAQDASPVVIVRPGGGGGRLPGLVPVLGLLWSLGLLPLSHHRRDLGDRDHSLGLIISLLLGISSGAAITAGGVREVADLITKRIV